MANFPDATAAGRPLVSVLFLTYKRLDLLKNSIERFRAYTDYPNLELVIADDGSSPAIQSEIRRLPGDRFALRRHNKGLGANFNQGLALCSGKYILVIQDDWMCSGPPDYLAQAVNVFESNPDLGLINFAGAAHPPDFSMPLGGGDELCYRTPEPRGGPIEYFLYSDQPHLQSRAAVDYVGPYLESRDMEECETNYNRRWKDQNRFHTAVFPAYYMRVFSNVGEQHSFRTTRLRYKVHKALLPVKPFMTQHMPFFFGVGKAAVERTLRFFERRGLSR
jgi:glycosyltransferase involved in cell wall biosynthesis